MFNPHEVSARHLRLAAWVGRWIATAELCINPEPAEDAGLARYKRAGETESKRIEVSTLATR